MDRAVHLKALATLSAARGEHDDVSRILKRQKFSRKEKMLDLLVKGLNGLSSRKPLEQRLSRIESLLMGDPVTAPPNQIHTRELILAS